MSILFYRIDDRLIHGQVMTGWVRDLKANHIYIIDDKVAKDPFLTQVMMMSSPQDVSVHVLGLINGIEALKKDLPENRTIVLAKTPEIMLSLLNAGLPMTELNVGGMGTSVGRKNVLRNIQISPEEIETLKEMNAKGVRIYFQIVPGDKRVELDKIK